MTLVGHAGTPVSLSPTTLIRIWNKPWKIFRTLRKYLWVTRAKTRVVVTARCLLKSDIKMTPLGDNGNKTRSRLFQVVILKQQKVPTVVRCSLNLSSDGYEMTFDALSLFATEPLWSWLAFLQYYCLNALFWPIFDGIVNHKHHDFDVNKSERDDYGHYWTISESDLDLKTSAAREWASRACLLVGGPLLTLWPTFELREKYSNPPSFGRELNLL